MTFAVGNASKLTRSRSRVLRWPSRWIHVCKAAPLAGGRELTSYSCPDCGARRP